jgi:hypothetical protein
MHDLFSEGEALKLKGISDAAEHAEREHPNWNKDAIHLLQIFCQFKGLGNTFTAEEFREYAEAKKLPEPPSLRAYGSVILKCSRAGFIAHAGYTKVKNPKAHRATASVWKVIDYLPF